MAKPKKDHARTETVTVRLEPKLRYLAELGARKQHRTLSSFVEAAIADALDRVVMRDTITLGSQTEHLWDVRESARFTKLAKAFPELLDYQQQMILGVVRGNPYFWNSVKYDEDTGDVLWNMHLDHMVPYKVWHYFDLLRDVADGKKPSDALPQWEPPKASKAELLPPEAVMPELEYESDPEEES